MPKSVSLVPPQHGAWAFLGLPLAVGWTVSSWTPLLVLLAVAWVAAYPASYFALAIVADRSRRRPQPERFVRPLTVWATPVVITGAVLLWFRPWLLWVGVAYLAAFAVNVAFARRRDDRALTNDAVFIVECAAMAAVTWAVSVGGDGWTPPTPVPTTVWILTIAVALLLTGSMLHVKSLIRERANPRYAQASRALAVGSVPLAALLAVWWGLPSGLWLVLPFAFAAARSFLVRDPGTRPGRIGMVELVAFVLMVVAAVLA